MFHAPVHLVVANQHIAFHRGTHHPGKQGVSPVLQEAAYAKRVAFIEGVPTRIALQFAQEILPQHVKGLPFGGLKNGVDPSQAGGLSPPL